MWNVPKPTCCGLQPDSVKSGGVMNVFVKPPAAFDIFSNDALRDTPGMLDLAAHAQMQQVSKDRVRAAHNRRTSKRTC